jgi:uncharacterized peroxidase-related enzyme
MSWVRTIAESEAEGYIGQLYARMRRQRGWIPNIQRSTSIRPGLTQAWMELFTTLMFGPSDLSRAQREMVALVVSVANRCHY